MSAILAVASVFCGCQVNVVTLESLIFRNPNVGYALTFLQFVFVALASLPMLFSFRHWRLRPRSLDPVWLIILCAVFWTVSAMNNMVFAYKIAMPIHTTFRSSSMVVNILIGIFFFKKRYSKSQIFCAAVITAGIIILTMETNRRAQAEVHSSVPPTAAHVAMERGEAESLEAMDQSFFSSGSWFSIVNLESQFAGIVLLAVGVVLSTVLGLLQDKIMSQARAKKLAAPPVSGTVDAPEPAKLWAECMFFAHATAPLFLVRYSQLSSELETLFSTPESIQLVAWNCITQLFCVCGVYQLADRTNSFTVTLVLTLRKFVSITFSVFYFDHVKSLGSADWFAIVLVAAAGLAYPFVPKADAALEVNTKKDLKAKKEQ